ncbi:MAG: hypothetical protein BGO98_21865 [Myxococcales bacterium 68-20]|nr:MAG: hypothetical protein BGO98_21865 [Myxococcales bacterium 68-20]
MGIAVAIAPGGFTFATTADLVHAPVVKMQLRIERAAISGFRTYITACAAMQVVVFHVDTSTLTEL